MNYMFKTYFKISFCKEAAHAKRRGEDGEALVRAPKNGTGGSTLIIFCWTK